MSCQTPAIKCPYCKAECHADWVDVEVGMIQCGPYHCESCDACETGRYDTNTNNLSDEEKKTGWFKGRYGNTANTINGELVDHKTAKQAYRIGRLDKKKL